MHAVKGGWVGQTFALAKCNESGGKKTRVRRSKEERKSMVESFIKKYQESNNGNFPSLNLTHKEVGGSFYIIREIVREIIQENRVLGPAKLTEGEHDIDRFLQQNPLGSISTPPEPLLSEQSNGSSFVPSHHEDESDESVMITNGNSMESENKEFGSEKIINGNLVDVTNGTDKAALVEVQVIEPPESDKSKKETYVFTSKVIQVEADIVVETFPLRPVAKPTDSVNGMSSEVGKLDENLYKTENGKLNVSQENGSFKLDGMNSSEVSVLTDDGKEVENNVGLLLEKNSNLTDKKMVESISDPLSESSECSTGVTAKLGTPNGAALEVSRTDTLMSDTNEQSKAIVGEAINVSNGFHPKNHGTYESTSERAVAVESKVDAQHVNSKKGSSKTLDRINLESWEGTSKSRAESETNPLWTIFKSFVTAFINFWSE
ncbi:hypothetical protein ERO13_D01G118500v2 [Gossypium hirsutum]|uniref:AT3G52170-like helix-turn-helix domain-containing protein n=1 Tax=Gossypium hirsutum TaxID=3635 RepID=A0A1U8L0E3_GOSHI|nr:uncharacterized protein LOC107922513 [Gossypium hirsutum]KAG4162500.1 hypothetical protein ERO13_D01G118500v2 [Gossypium hirsutum]